MFKKLFSKLFGEKKPEELKINISRLDEKYEELFSEFKKNEIEPQFNEIISTIKPCINAVEEKCSLLENAKLKNPNITAREKNAMEGNRAGYIKHSRILLRELQLPGNYEEIKVKYGEFEKLIEHFTKQTVRPRQILSHFFEHETSAIHQEIGKITRNFQKLKSIVESEKFRNFSELKGMIKKYHNSELNKKSIKDEIKNSERYAEELKDKIKKLEKELKSKKEGSDYKKVVELNQRKEELGKKINQIKTVVVERFSRLERALKKYDRIAMDDAELVRLYLSSAFKAISQDTDLKGNGILDSMLSGIEKGSIDLKDKQKNKALNEIKSMKEEDFVKKKHGEIVEINEKLGDIDAEVKRDTVSKAVNELEEEITIQKNKLADLENKTGTKKKELDDIDENTLLEKIKSMFGMILDSKIIIEK